MFTWICPKCGREVPPAYDDCPDCSPKPAATAAPPPAPVREPDPPPVQAAPPPPPSAPPPQPVEAPPPPASAPPREPAAQPSLFAPPVPATRPHAVAPALPTWLLAVISALAFVGLILGSYWLVGAIRGRGHSSEPTPAAVSPAAKADANANPFQRFVEVSALRFIEDPKHKGQLQVQFAITNHSEAQMGGLGGTVTVWSRTQKSEEEIQGTFTFSTDLKPMESKELTAPLDTKLKIYELADWPNATADVLITAPAGVSPGSRGPQ